MNRRESSTYTCPSCRRQIRTLADEYGDYGCICGWQPQAYGDSELERDIEAYVEWCRGNGFVADAFAFALSYQRKYGRVPGRVIDELITKEMVQSENYGDSRYWNGL